MRLQQTAARLRALLGEKSDFATVLRGAGLVVVIRLLASAVGFASVVLLARWMGSAQYGLYSFAIAWMILLANPATLGLPGTAVRFVAQYVAADDWQHVIGFLKASSGLAFGCGVLVAVLAIGAVLASKSSLAPEYVWPMIVALCGIPIVATIIVRSEAIRGLGWLALAWAPAQLGQPLILLVITAIVLFATGQLTATLAVAAAIAAYAANLAVQWGILRARLGTRARVEPRLQLGAWVGVATSFLWVSLASVTLLQAGVIVVGIFLEPHDVAVYSAAQATSGLVALPLYSAVALGAPKFAALHAQQRRPELQALFTNIVRLAFWPSLAIVLAFAAFGSLVLRLFGPGFEQGYRVLLILSLGQLASTFIGPMASLLTMTGHHVVTARVLATGAITAVALGLVFTPIWGSVGTAVAFASVMVLGNAWLTLFVVRKLDIYPSLPVAL